MEVVGVLGSLQQFALLRWPGHHGWPDDVPFMRLTFRHSSTYSFIHSLL